MRVGLYTPKGQQLRFGHELYLLLEQFRDVSVILLEDFNAILDGNLNRARAIQTDGLLDI